MLKRRALHTARASSSCMRVASARARLVIARRLAKVRAFCLQDAQPHFYVADGMSKRSLDGYEATAHGRQAGTTSSTRLYLRRPLPLIVRHCGSASVIR